MPTGPSCFFSPTNSVVARCVHNTLITSRVTQLQYDTMMAIRAMSTQRLHSLTARANSAKTTHSMGFLRGLRKASVVAMAAKEAEEKDNAGALAAAAAILPSAWLLNEGAWLITSVSL